MNVTEVKLKNHYILYDKQYIENPNLSIFDVSAWEQGNAITGVAEGRGTTYFVTLNDLELVLRHYRRGGLIARISADKYCWFGIRHTRAWREWYMLAKMSEVGLPVPVPIAARVSRRGLSYTADIVTLRIPDVETLTVTLCRKQLQQSQWEKLGGIIHSFHRTGVWHADLNANNILIGTDGKFHIIDFDKCRFRKADEKWQLANLKRLKRSLDKLSKINKSFNFSVNNWDALLRGYAC